MDLTPDMSGGAAHPTQTKENLLNTLLSPESSVTHRYSEMSSEDFAANLDRTWQALNDVKTVISEHVKNGNINPIDGIRGFSALSSNILGYEEFVPRGQVGSVFSSQ